MGRPISNSGLATGDMMRMKPVSCGRTITHTYIYIFAVRGIPKPSKMYGSTI